VGLRTTFLAAMLVALLGLAACGGSPSSGGGNTKGKADSVKDIQKVESQVKGLTGKAREDKLVELADKEGGQLNLYTSLTPDALKQVEGDFTDKYDKINLNVYRADSETVLQRLVQESKAKFKGADAVETNGPELYSLDKSSVLVPYDSPANADLVKDATAYKGFTADRFNEFAISWNTKLVPSGQQPKSWEELADPKWNGKLAMELEDVDWYKTLYDYWVSHGKSKEQAQKLFEDMARGARFVKGHTVMGDLLGSGEFSVAASNYSYLTEGVKKKGGPVEWERVPPPILRPNGVGVVNGVRHPATAMLFQDWILTDGQDTLAKLKLTPARKDIAGDLAKRGIFVDLRSLSAGEQEWTDRYEKLTRLGKVQG
jgi:iron(III) transport system substrate-binding protein